MPFLQMVYSGLTGYAGETVNLSADPDSAVLHAIATGEALHYELITGDAELLIDTDLNTLFSARPELWLPHMKEAAAQVAQAREATEILVSPILNGSARVCRSPPLKTAR